jgi:hypothetical protein
MPRGVPHSLELRAQVVAAVLAGTSIAQAAAQFKLDKGLVSRWVQSAEVATVATEKSDGLQSLMLRYLYVGLQALITQAEVLGDPAYCRAQSANDLAIAHGVLVDKLAGVATRAEALGIQRAAEHALEAAVDDDGNQP